ncbi:diguanylate cyclase [Shimwellia pseudoproteus]|uniref:diguanylate cyclase domain-containing protein n=1 Tax=Shimwellia pseudoproteus TaxID=570012 RepID=UPI0018EDDECB|nr:diguanylate cyclase [Shimwellia pseudoproteus]MBJ3816466.1 diguanylate cyclase [Shimwellia pseudoproteus]
MIPLFAVICFFCALFSMVLAESNSVLTPLWLPTALMMIAAFHLPLRHWPGVLLCCTLGAILANALFYPGTLRDSLPFYVINVIEALIGATLLRTRLTMENPLKNLSDWGQLVLCCAVIPPVIGGVLVTGLGLSERTLHTFFTWVLSESIGALAMVPLGLVITRQHLARYHQPRLLAELLITLIITLLLCWLALHFLPWPFTFVILITLWSAVRLPRMDAFLIFLVTQLVISMLVSFNPSLLLLNNIRALHNASWLPFLMVLLPANMLTMVMYASREERKHIAESEIRFRNAMEYSAIGMALVSLNGQWMQVNKSLCKFLGYSSDQMMSLNFQKITHPDDLNADLVLLERLIGGEINHYAMEKRYLRHDGTPVWALLAVSSVRDASDSLLYFIAQIEDINELKLAGIANQRLHEALYQEKERLHITLHSIGEAVLCTDDQLQITFMNPVAEKLSGWEQQSGLGQPLQEVLQLTQGKSGPVVEDLLHHDSSRPALEQDVVLHCRRGGHYDIHYRITPLKTREGQNIGYVLVIQDVSESRSMMRQLSYRASHDGLTRLANRVSFEHYLDHLLSNYPHSAQQHVLGFIDLDHFKQVNDVAGHAAGDALLCELSALMQNQLRSSDFLARLGGDEFAIILPHCLLADGQRVIADIVRAINGYHFQWGGQTFRIGASAGVTQINTDNCQASELMAQADIACYHSKHNGRGRVSPFIAEPDQSAATAAPPLQHLMARWLGHHPPALTAQPVLHTDVPDSCSFWRVFWHWPADALRDAPFTPMALASRDESLISEFDCALAREFVENYARRVSLKGITVSLPLSLTTLSSPERFRQWLALLEPVALQPRHILVEIPATACRAPQPAAVHSALNTLRQRGCEIIALLPANQADAVGQLDPALISYVLIDPGQVQNIHDSPVDGMMVTMIHNHSRRHNLISIAGPVTLPAAAEALKSIGVNLMYGDAIQPQQPLDQLLSSSYFAIN